MSSAGASDLLHRYVREVWGRRDLSALERYLAAGYRRHVSPVLPPLNLDGQKRLLTAFWTSFPDAELTIGEVVACGDRLVFRSTVRATHEGEFRGVAPTGARVIVGLLDMVRLEDGRFAEQWGGPDVADLLRQLRAGGDATGPA